MNGRWLLVAANAVCLLVATSVLVVGDLAPSTAADRPFVAPPPSTSTLTAARSYGGTRQLVLHVPAGLTSRPPLIIALHARAQGPAAIREYTRLEQLADREGFVVAFPGGAGGSWNAGTCCRPGSDIGTDDVAFLDELIELVRDEVDIDMDRIGLTGTSNGGMMALRYACERADVVASVAVVSSVLVAPCAPREPVSVLQVHGELDGVIPLAGGRNAELDTVFPPVDGALAPFRAAGGPVELRVVAGAGHPWMTVPATGVDASQAVWEWVRDHPRA